MATCARYRRMLYIDCIDYCCATVWTACLDDKCVARRRTFNNTSLYVFVGTISLDKKVYEAANYSSLLGGCETWPVA